MSDKEELHSRVGQFEQALSAFDSKQKALLHRLQDGLGLARQKLVERKLEIERLKRENRELRQIIDRLLQSVEEQSKDAMGEQLGALDRELASLMALADDETASAGEPAGSVPDGRNEPGGDAPAAEAVAEVDIEADADDDELTSTFSDIQRRIQDLAEQFPKDEISAEASAPALAEPGEPAEPAAAATVEPTAPASPVATGAEATPTASAPSHPAPSHSAPSHPAPSYRPAARPAPAPAKSYSNARGPLDAEVGYALSVLRQMRRSDKLFSIEDIRGLINGKFGLELTAQQDSQIRASLSRRDGVYPNPKNENFWRFGDAA